MSNENLYETNSLPLAVTLVCLGYNLDTHSKDDLQRVIFYFKFDETLMETLEKYWKKLILVEPNAYWDAIKFLKSLIYG
jgi:hypothetical protein